MSTNAQNANFNQNTIRKLTHGVGKVWIDMIRDRFHGIWMQLSGKLKEQWGTLIHEQFAMAAGMRDRIAGRAQGRRGISKQEADRQLKDFMIRNRNWWDLTRH